MKLLTLMLFFSLFSCATHQQTGSRKVANIESACSKTITSLEAVSPDGDIAGEKHAELVRAIRVCEAENSHPKLNNFINAGLEMCEDKYPVAQTWGWGYANQYWCKVDLVKFIKWGTFNI